MSEEERGVTEEFVSTAMGPKEAARYKKAGEGRPLLKLEFVEGMDELDAIIRFFDEIDAGYEGHMKNMSNIIKELIQDKMKTGEVREKQGWLPLSEMTQKLRGSEGWMTLLGTPATASKPILIETGTMVKNIQIEPINKWISKIGYWGIFPREKKYLDELTGVKTVKMGTEDIGKVAVAHEFGANIKVFKRGFTPKALSENIRRQVAHAAKGIGAWALWQPLPQRRHLGPILEHWSADLIIDMQKYIKKETGFNFSMNTYEE